MFFDEVINDWDELTYVPNSLGKTMIALLTVLLLIAAAWIAKILAQKSQGGAQKKEKEALTVKQLAVCAMALAFATLLSNIKLFHFPTGGSITLFSMLVICLPGFFYGLVPGILTGLAYGTLQMLIDPYILSPMQAVIDYFLAFSIMGLSGIFYRKKNGLLPAYIVAVLGRYIAAVISGWVFFGAYAWEGWGALPYSMAYNAIYIFAEAAVTIVVLCLPPVKNAIASIKTEAVNS